MFATLMVCLPSEHVGGDLVLSHGGKKMTFSTSDSSTYGVSYMGW